MVKSEMVTYGEEINLPVVAEQFRHKMKRGEFVDFNAMLSSLAGKSIIPGYALAGKSIIPGYALAGKSIIPGYAFALKTDSITPQILIAQQEEKSHIYNLQTWMKAWTLYLEIFGFYHPHLWEKLVRYQGIIVRYSFEFSDFAWLKYDSLFRHTVALDSRVQWDVEHDRLYNENLKGRNKMEQVREPALGSSGRNGSTQKRCYNSNRIGHISRNCFKPKVDLAGRPATGSNETGAMSGGECDRYNRGLFCNSRVCKFAHGCSLCGVEH